MDSIRKLLTIAIHFQKYYNGRFMFEISLQLDENKLCTISPKSRDRSFHSAYVIRRESV